MLKKDRFPYACFRFFWGMALLFPLLLTACQKEEAGKEASSVAGNAEKASHIDGVYEEQEALEIIRQTYGVQVALVSYQESVFTFRQEITEPTAGSFLFQAENNSALTDNYRQELFRCLGEAFFAGKNRSFHWQESGFGIEKQYVPVVACNGRGGSELEWYCNDICDFVDYCRRNEAFADSTWIFPTLIVSLGNETASFTAEDQATAYDRTEFYNDLYTFLDEFTLSAMDRLLSENAASKDQEDINSVSQETLDYYLSIEASCTYRMENGMEYRMIAVDRAAGSSYYVLIGTADKGKSCAFLNSDPYNGSGGEAKWLTFLDETLGFSCLAYSGGAYGSLYRTEDGGVTFVEVEYPSAKVLLPDGTYYHPFVMPDEIYEKDGMLYLVAGQGPDGDYYNSEGRCSGLYSSEDQGKTWIYVGEVME